MPYLRLISLTANETEDSGCDEPYLKVGGRKKWGSGDFCQGQTADLTGVRRTRFGSQIRVELWERDPWDPDDKLGEAIITSDIVDQEQEVFFTDDDAEYLLTYVVDP